MRLVSQLSSLLTSRLRAVQRLPLADFPYAYAGMENQLKVAVELRSQQRRYGASMPTWQRSMAAEYTKIQMEKEIES